MNIQIQYFAILKEQRGLSEENYETKAPTAGDLYQELKDRYKFSLDSNCVKVAVNNEFANWEYILKPDDTVIFIPPVAGG